MLIDRQSATFNGKSITLLSFNKQVSDDDLEYYLSALSLKLVEVNETNQNFAVQLRDELRLTVPLVFAKGKYILHYGKLGTSYDKPTPLWSEQCIFVTMKTYN